MCKYSMLPIKEKDKSYTPEVKSYTNYDYLIV